MENQRFIQRQLRELWDQLRGKKPHMPHFLDEVRLDGLRGLKDLRISLQYPVSVIAGTNASGKSTVLFSLAAAYRVPDTSARTYAPAALFPNYSPKAGEHRDPKSEITMDYEYSTPEGGRTMRWRRSKSGWSRSYFGRPAAKQPERALYLRTLSNLSNPSEIRSLLSMSSLSQAPTEHLLTPEQLSFASGMLPLRYDQVARLETKKKNLLFAQSGSTSYSEFHMSSGERAILRMSAEIAQIDDALILIDEVEAGLHPWVQQLLMLQLQQLALRNNLQIVVTSHSPAVLDCVPPEGRIFLDRDSDTGEIRLTPPHRDLIQNALYGRSKDKLNILCEDDVSEGIIRGVLDHLWGTGAGIRHEQIEVGRDTGASEFPQHAKAFSSFDLLQNFIFVMDGDQKNTEIPEKIQEQSGSQKVPIIFLPGDEAPEVWLWRVIEQGDSELHKQLGIDRQMIDQINNFYAQATGSESKIAKTKVADLANRVSRGLLEYCRSIARHEAENDASELQPVITEIRDTLEKWRSLI